MIAFGGRDDLRRKTFVTTPALPVRDVGEMRLSEHLAGPGCPLCAARAAIEVRLIDSLIGEAVNDIGVRADLDRSGGYCARHLAMLPERERRLRGGTLGSAILLGAVLRRRLERLGGWCETLVLSG